MDPRSSNPALGGDPAALRNRQSLVRLAMMIGFAVMIAAASPAALAVAAFSSLLLLGSLVASGFAMFGGERPSAPHFTRWDEAAALFALSMLAGFFVDPAAVQAAVAQAQATP